LSTHGLVIDAQRDRVGVAIFAAVGEREARRVGEPAGCAVNDLGDQRQREQRPRAHARRQHQLGEVSRPALRHRCQRLAGAP
jgi:hypothetical protein